MERLLRPDYLELYRRVGTQVRWDQRLQMPSADLDELLAGDRLHVHVLRTAAGDPIGLCEFDRSGFPDIEIKNFGLVPASQGRGLGAWLLAEALHGEWASGVTRIWLHTDSWDHPAAMHLYHRAGFRVFAERDEPAAPL
ncbi:MAG TPA: GNAT family N-acetyltransferase [Steroidobacteraceae bacterium]|nr:GNAT family N-acetyltransferase [Steroidobacteraceae bacterium]